MFIFFVQNLCQVLKMLWKLNVSNVGFCSPVIETTFTLSSICSEQEAIGGAGVRVPNLSPPGISET